MSDCKVANCTFSKDAVCLEGRKSNCPNLVLTESSDSGGQSVSVPPQAAESLYPPSEALYSGLPLEIAEAREFTGRSRAIVVSLAGMSESGKTSLLARLHQQFQNGPVGSYLFAGSRTLWRFEELNWLATVESGVDAPMMEHTSRRYDNSFLHFTVRPCPQDEPLGPPTDLLLNDVSGETFPEAVSEERACEQLICLRRADHVVLVVDGAAIADREMRHDHCAKAKNFVQRTLQTGQIGRRTVLHLVITKLDVLLSPEGKDENLRVAEKLADEFRVQFCGRVAEFHSWKLAARPLDGTLPTEDVIAQLFTMWITSTFRYTNAENPQNAFAEPARDFCRFGS